MLLERLAEHGVPSGQEEAVRARVIRKRMLAISKTDDMLNQLQHLFPSDFVTADDVASDVKNVATVVNCEKHAASVCAAVAAIRVQTPNHPASAAILQIPKLAQLLNEATAYATASAGAQMASSAGVKSRQQAMESLENVWAMLDEGGDVAPQALDHIQHLESAQKDLQSMMAIANRMAVDDETKRVATVELQGLAFESMKSYLQLLRGVVSAVFRNPAEFRAEANNLQEVYVYVYVYVYVHVYVRQRAKRGHKRSSELKPNRTLQTYILNM